MGNALVSSKTQNSKIVVGEDLHCSLMKQIEENSNLNSDVAPDSEEHKTHKSTQTKEDAKKEELQTKSAQINTKNCRLDDWMRKEKKFLPEGINMLEKKKTIKKDEETLQKLINVRSRYLKDENSDIKKLQEMYNKKKEDKLQKHKWSEIGNHNSKKDKIKIVISSLDCVNSVAVSNDNRFIVSGSADNSIKIFDLQTKQELHHFKDAHTVDVLSVAVSNDNKFIVSGFGDKSKKIFELQTKQELHHFKDAHTECVHSVAVSNDNRFIVSGSWDKSIKIFDLQTKQELDHFKDAHTCSPLFGSLILLFSSLDWVSSVAVSNDNRFIVSGAADNSIKIFLVPNNLETEIFYESLKFSWIRNCFLSGFENDLIPSFKSSESFNQILSKFDGFYLTPFYWTSLHITCIFQNTQFIDQIPSDDEFKIPFLLDRFGKTPFEYLILHEDIYYSPAAKILNYMIDYLEDRNKRTADEAELIFKSLTPFFPFILAKIDSKIRDRYLKAIFMSSYSTPNLNLPDFGFAQTQYSLSERSIITPQILSHIHDGGTDKVLFRTIMLYLPYNSFETELYNIVWLLLYLQNEDIFKSTAINLLIDYLWDLSQFIIKLSALPFWIYMILLSV